MLKTRVLTAAVLLPAALALIFLVPPEGFAWAAAAVVMIGAFEFRKLAALERGAGAWLLPVLEAALLLALAWRWSSWSADPTPMLILACAAWLLIFSELFTWRSGQGLTRGFRVRAVITGLSALSFAWIALTWLRQESAGQWWILLLLLTIWAADVGAYFSGRAIGGPKLAPRISPGKTVAGFVGGLLCAAAVAALAAHWLPGIDAGWAPAALLGLVTALVSVGGDLIISLHKRTVGCKDTGRIFPGHGGVLDRLDSLLAGAPFFALGKVLGGW